MKWRGNSPLPTFSPEPREGEVDGDGRGGPTKIPTSPSLKRRIMPTYKGRPVRADMWRGEPRFIDDAAVYVGGLPLTETEQTILERFSKHGKVAGIEMERRFKFNDARIMFEEQKSAQRARMYEDGAIVSGSPIRVKDRRVHPHYVDKSEVYVDDSGRVVRPAEVHENQSDTNEPEDNHGTEDSQEPEDQESGHTTPRHDSVVSSSGAAKDEEDYIYVNVKVPRVTRPATGGEALPAYMVYFDYSDSGEVQTRLHLCPPVGVSSTPAGTELPGSRTASRCGTDGTATASKGKAPVRTPPIKPNEFLPRVLSTKMEGGELKPTYDPDDIKLWKLKNGIPLEDEPREALSRTEPLSLLPVSTGGHDLARVSESRSAPRPQAVFPPRPSQQFHSQNSNHRHRDHRQPEQPGAPRSPTHRPAPVTATNVREPTGVRHRVEVPLQTAPPCQPELPRQAQPMMHPTELPSQPGLTREAQPDYRGLQHQRYDQRAVELYGSPTHGPAPTTTTVVREPTGVRHQVEPPLQTAPSCQPELPRQAQPMMPPTEPPFQPGFTRQAQPHYRADFAPAPAAEQVPPTHTPQFAQSHPGHQPLPAPHSEPPQPASPAPVPHHEQEEYHGESIWDPPPRPESVAPSEVDEVNSTGGW